MSLDPAEREALLALVDAARKALDAGQPDLAEDTLAKVRARFGEAPELLDLLAEICELRGEDQQALTHFQRAWTLEPSAWRGLAIAERLPWERQLGFLGEVLSRFGDEERVVIALVRRELGEGGFDAGDTASSVLVDLVTGGSAELMDAMAKVLQGQDLESEAMMAFQPLVSADITRRVREERRAAGEELREDETADEMNIAATLSIPPIDAFDEEVGDASTEELRERARRMLDQQGQRQVQTADRELWRRSVDPWLDWLVALPGVLLAFGFAFLGFRDTLLASNSLPLVAWVTIPTVLSFIGIAAAARVRRVEIQVRSVLLAPIASCLVAAAFLGLGGILVGDLDAGLVGHLGTFGLAGLSWGAAGAVGLRLSE